MKAKCKQCLDTGIIFENLWSESNNYELFCTCSKGRQEEAEYISYHAN